MGMDLLKFSHSKQCISLGECTILNRFWRLMSISLIPLPLFHLDQQREKSRNFFYDKSINFLLLREHLFVTYRLKSGLLKTKMHVLVHYLIDQTLLTEYTTAIRRASSPSLHFAKSLSAARVIKKHWIVAKIIWRVVLSSLDGYASNIGPWEQVLCSKFHEEANSSVWSAMIFEHIKEAPVTIIPEELSKEPKM